MFHPRPKYKNKHQVRTQETQSKILDAAQVIFSEQGFEKTQLEEVAVRAGYTRGAIYAHYSGKEDLFLALIEHCVLTKAAAVRQLIEGHQEPSERAGIFKRWIDSQLSDRSSGMLMLEFKLYALRRPRSREKLQRVFDLLFESSGNDIIEIFFGDDLDKASRAGAERCLAVMDAILSGVMLESLFRPKLIRKPHLRAVLEDLFEVLFHA